MGFTIKDPITNLCMPCHTSTSQHNDNSNLLCEQCPAGTFAGDLGGGPDCIPCPPNTFSADKVCLLLLSAPAPVFSLFCGYCSLFCTLRLLFCVLLHTHCCCCCCCCCICLCVCVCCICTNHNCFLYYYYYYKLYEKGWTACRPCAPYTSSSSGAQNCVCALGTITDYALLRCLPCPLGWYYYISNGSCVPCPSGTYNPNEMASSCSTCPNGTDAPFSGSSACVDCKAEVSPDRTACHCPAGTFNLSLSFFSWECSKCAAACPQKGQYISKGCTPDADIECSDCSRNDDCASGTFLLANCSATSDRVCWQCSRTCPIGYFISAACTSQSNAKCKACTGNCPVDTFMEVCIYSFFLCVFIIIS